MKRRSYKKRKTSRKNIKRVSLKKMKKAHKKHLAHHYLKGKHKTHRSRSRLGGSGCMCGGRKGMKGGNACGDGTCMVGGMVSSPAAGPVGYSWNGGDIGTWPGAAATKGLDTNGATMSNHFKLSPNGIVVGGLNPARSTTDDQLMTPPMNGGRKRKGKGSKQKGGFFQELVNLGRGAQYNIQGVGYGLAGKLQPISQNPFPTEGQPIDGDFKFIGGQPPDVRKIFIDANNQVAQI
jgi:hypothetical protein